MQIIAKGWDWPLLVCGFCFIVSWRFATLWQGSDDYWFALRIYPFGLLLTVAMFCGTSFGLLFYREAGSLAAKISWAVLLALEIAEPFVYATCKLLSNPLLDAEGNRIGPMEMALLWGVEVPKMSCSRVLDWIPPNALSYAGALVIVWVFVRAWQTRTVEQ